ncbi:MAG: DUF296 domain-containing protein [Candidatus Diapherotrites archaeon]
MPYIDAQLFKKKGEKKVLRLVLDEGDIVLDSIKKAMAEHEIEQAKVEDMNGILREATVNYMNGSRYESKVLKNQQILRASGNFKHHYGELYGSMNVSTADKNPLTATFVKGKAAEGLEIKMSFIQLTG